MRARDRNSTYSIDQTAYIPMQIPLTVDTSTVSLSTIQSCGRISVYGHKVIGDVDDNRLSLRSVRSAVVQVFEVCAVRLTTSFTSGVSFHNDETIHVTVRFTADETSMLHDRTTTTTKETVHTEATHVNMTVVIVSVVFAIALIIGSIVIQYNRTTRASTTTQHATPASPQSPPLPAQQPMSSQSPMPSFTSPATNRRTSLFAFIDLMNVLL